MLHKTGHTPGSHVSSDIKASWTNLKEDHLRIFSVTYYWILATSFQEEDFLNFHWMKRATPSGGHVVQINVIILRNLRECHLRVISVKFWCNLTSGFWEDDFLNYCCYIKRATPLAAMFLKILKRFEQTWKRTS